MDYKDLDAWKQAILLVEDIYRISISFPKEELFGLTSQMRRAAVSIPSNLSEGSARNSNKEFAQFLHIALGSLAELETQLIIVDRLAYGEIGGAMERLIRVRSLLLGLRTHIRRTLKPIA